ncbi:MAG TPA: GAF domain-containing protein [Vicinamibacterales bacterium]|nr:GAF domain-containing protein [Vicinamibacterales bacterium]
MNVTLESLATCFQGILPAQLFTCSADGIPNAAYLSHVEYVDDSHVALSFQFFNKSRRNVAHNPRALVMVPDPDTGQGWLLRVRFVRSETEGPLFEQMALRIEAIASYCGLKGIFKLRAADVYEVLSIERAPEEAGAPSKGIDQDAAALMGAVFTTKALQDLAIQINHADTLDALVDAILRGLDESLGFKHSAILVPAEEPGVLVTIATRGYPENGAGAEVRFGEGIAGLVAEARKPIRISGLMRGMLYAFAMHKDAADRSAGLQRRRIPMPGLANPESQLGVPLLVRGELVGVLTLESDMPYRFHAEDKASIELLGSYLAIAIQNMQLQERTAEPADAPAHAPARRGVRAASRPAEPAARRDIVYYAADECILLDGEYLIRSLPAKILWRLLTERETTGRQEFTNRELRLDKSLNLPDWKDNLESRLLLLRRRLQQKSPDIRLVPRARGRFALELGCEVSLSVRP